MKKLLFGLGAIFCVATAASDSVLVKPVHAPTGIGGQNSGDSEDQLLVREIDGAYIATDDYYVPGQTMDLLFFIQNSSSDAEWIDSATITFGQGTTINTSSNFLEEIEPIRYLQYDSTTGENVTVSWYDPDGECGEIYSDERAVATINITFSNSLSGLISLSYTLSGDLWGSPPHDVNGVLYIDPYPYHSTVISVSPSTNSNNNESNTLIMATFDTTMDASTINDTTFVVHASMTGLHTGTISYDPGTKTAIFDPATDFAPGEVVTATLTSGIQSTDGIPLRPYSWSFTIEAAAGPALFDKRYEYSLGSLPQSAILADMDGDMILDVVAANEDADSITVRFGSGTGEFGPDNAFYFLGPDRPIAVAPASFNPDQFMDWALLSDDNSVAIYLGNSDSSFVRTDGASFSGTGEVIVVADMDNDGNTDIVVPRGGRKNFYVVFTDNQGQIVDNGDYSTSGDLMSLCSGDLNGDGYRDVVTASYTNNEVEVFLNVNAGSFNDVDTYPTGDYPVAVKAVDVDGDFDLDIVVVNRDDNTVSVLRGNGDGTLTAQEVYATGAQPVALECGDIDGDGDLDVMVANEADNNVSLLLNNGDGTFADQVVFPVGTGPTSISLGDLDGDGDLDLVTANSGTDSISVLLNYLCIDTDGDGFGDPGHPENDCADDNCPIAYNPLQEDYDLDGIGDSCDPCNDFPPVLTQVDDTVLVQFLTAWAYYPNITDPDNASHTISYTEYPHWCTIQNDSVIGTAPDTIFSEPLTVTVEDTCNVASQSFLVVIYLCGDVNNDGGSTIDISDLVYLVDYMFTGGPPPPLMEAADVDGNGSIDISDLVYLVDYMFNGGPPPVCP